VSAFAPERKECGRTKRHLALTHTSTRGPPGKMSIKVHARWRSTKEWAKGCQRAV